MSATGTLPGSSLDGAALPIIAHARWAADPVIDTSLPGDALTITTTSSGSFTPTVADSEGDPYPTDPADWSISDAGGLVNAGIDPATGRITVSGSAPGSHTLTLAVPTAAGTITADIVVTVGLTHFDTGPTAGFTGVLQVGDTLTADAGSIAPTPDEVVFTWLADGIAVGTGRTYRLTAADAGTRISLRATASRAGYAEASDTSAAAGPVTSPPVEPPPSGDADPIPFDTPPSAAFTGVLRVGALLTADPGTISPLPDTVAFTWFADGVPVGTGPTYRLTTADAGALISLRVVASRTGRVTASVISAEVGPVAAATAGAPDGPDELPVTGAELSGWLTGLVLLLGLGVGLLAVGVRSTVRTPSEPENH